MCKSTNCKVSFSNHGKLICEHMLVEVRKMGITIDWKVHEGAFLDARNALYLDLCGGYV